jgi:lipopolysaccharide transport system permease protein
MLIIYTFVFSVVFKARWGADENESKTEFAIILFAGMIVFNIFSEVVNRAPSLILSNVNYVKKVVFPLEILPWVALGASLFHAGASLLVLLVAQLLFKVVLPWTVLLFPLVLLPLIFFTMGLAWFLAAMGVFIRDIGQITSVVTTVLMFLSALFYPVSALPRDYQAVLSFNPLVHLISESRKVLVFALTPAWGDLVMLLLASLGIASLGFWWFQKMRKGFADVI